MQNNESFPDPLTVAFPNLLRSIPADEQQIEILTFTSTPGAGELTEFIIRVDADSDTTISRIAPISAPTIEYDMTGEIVLNPQHEEILRLSEEMGDPVGDVIDESDAEAVTEIIELDEQLAAPAIADEDRSPALPNYFYRGRRRAETNTLAWALLISGVAMLVYGIGVQLYLPHHPLLIAISVPALVLAGAALMGALSEKR